MEGEGGVYGVESRGEGLWRGEERRAGLCALCVVRVGLAIQSRGHAVVITEASFSKVL